MHDHTHHSLKNHSPPNTIKYEKNPELRLFLIAFSLSLFAGLLEIIVKYFSGSVSLLGDGIHGIADGSTYGLFALAIIISRHIPSQKKICDIISVFFSFALLFIGVIWICEEAIDRFFVPQEVLGIWTFGTALFSFGLNLFVVRMIGKIPNEKHDIRHDSVSFHALSDMFVSIGVIISSAIMFTTKWYFGQGWYSIDWIMAGIIALYLLFLLCVLAVRIMRGNWNIEHDHSHVHHEHDKHDHHH